MIWIIHFLFVNLFFVISKVLKKDQLFIRLVFFYSIFVFGQRWMTGEDFPGYLLYYIIGFEGVEIGYKILQDFLSSYNIYFGVLIFIVYSVTLYNNLRFISKFEKNMVIMVYLYCFFELYFIQLSQIRQWIAISFFINAFYYSYTKERFKAVINLIIGATFHSSILLVSPFLFLKPKLSKHNYFYLYAFCLLTPFINVKFLLGLFGDMMYSGYVGGVYDVSLSMAHYLRYYGVLFLSILYVYNMDFSKKESHFFNVLNGHFIYLVLYGLSFKFAPFMRMSYYFKIYEIVFLIYNLNNIRCFSKKFVLRLVVVMTMFFYLSVAIIDPYNITRYQFEHLRLYETKSDIELRNEIKDFYE